MPSVLGRLDSIFMGPFPTLVAHSDMLNLWLFRLFVIIIIATIHWNVHHHVVSSVSLIFTVRVMMIFVEKHGIEC